MRRCREYCMRDAHGFCSSCGRMIRSTPAWKALPLWRRIALRWSWRFRWAPPRLPRELRNLF